MGDVRVPDMAAETAKSGRILPHQREAYVYLDKILTSEQRRELTRIWRQPSAAAKTLLQFFPTDVWENTPKGRLRRWELRLVGGGQVIDRVNCFTGAPGAQELNSKNDYPGSLRPLPPGRYRVGPVEVAPSGTWGEGLGRIWIGLTPLNPPNARSGFGIHLDANYDRAPGSAGCIVTRQEAELQRIVGWLKMAGRPDFLDCVHQVGGVPVPVANDLPLAGVLLIKEFEGCHLTAYPDPLTGGEPWTIGWGSTRYEDGSPVRPGQKVTQERADRLLEADCRAIVAELSRRIPGWDELSENRKGALLSFAYNVGRCFYGSPGFQTITQVLRDRQYDRVPSVLEMYRNPGSRVEAGLLRRRRAEGALWRRG